MLNVDFLSDAAAVHDGDDDDDDDDDHNGKDDLCKKDNNTNSIYIFCISVYFFSFFLLYVGISVIQSLGCFSQKNCNVFVSIFMFVPSCETRNCVDWRLLVKECIAKISNLVNTYFLMFWTISCVLK